TALAKSILEEAAKKGAIVLRGACREHESVTYNAFDSLVDAAAATVERKLAKGHLGEISGLSDLAAELGQIGRIFPVLRAPKRERGEASERIPVNPLAADVERGRAFAACRRVLERVTAVRPVVLLLDDLHWADEDSLQLLGHLLQPPAVRGLLV